MGNLGVKPSFPTRERLGEEEDAPPPVHEGLGALCLEDRSH